MCLLCRFSRFGEIKVHQSLNENLYCVRTDIINTRKIVFEMKAIDFFCSGGGMSFGFQEAGIQVIAGIDNDLSCKKTYERNIRGAKFLHEDITIFSFSSFENQIGVSRNDDSMIFVGCSPCQYWTILNTDKSKAEKSKNLLIEFGRFVEHYNPGYVIVENVPGILSKKDQSGFPQFLTILESMGYHVKYEIVNLNKFGVPQSRKRFSLVASRIGDKLIFPKPNQNEPVLQDFIGVKNGFPAIEAGNKDSSPFRHTTAGLSEINLERIRITQKNGGTRLDWAATELQLETYKKRDSSSFADSYGRMRWDMPAPTITTKFYSISNGRFGHPEEDRAISLREGATLQTFPKSFIFETDGISATARMIGNAVPPEYARRIGIEIMRNSDNGIY